MASKQGSAPRRLRHSLVIRLLLIVLGALSLPATAQVEPPYYERYGLSAASPATDVGIQPLGIPSGVVSAVMARDRILRATLKQLNAPLAAHMFRRGPDVVPLLLNRSLEAGLLGDMPTLLATADGRSVIAGLVKQTSTAIVAKEITRVSELAGKRIGYVELSSAHHTLLQGLAAAGLDERQVKLLPVAVNDMPDALDRGDIDAFAGWEPSPSIALGRSRNNRILFRGLSKDFLVIERTFIDRNPQAAMQLIAGLVRAIEWMRRSRVHLEQAIEWANADALAFVGKPHALPAEKIARIVHQELLDVPAAPVIPERDKKNLLKGEFDFLGRMGKLPTGSQWQHVADALNYDGLVQVTANPGKYRTQEFDYSN